VKVRLIKKVKKYGHLLNYLIKYNEFVTVRRNRQTRRQSRSFSHTFSPGGEENESIIAPAQLPQQKANASDKTPIKASWSR
jgi:hypothetical protein